MRPVLLALVCLAPNLSFAYTPNKSELASRLGYRAKDRLPVNYSYSLKRNFDLDRIAPIEFMVQGEYARSASSQNARIQTALFPHNYVTYTADSVDHTEGVDFLFYNGRSQAKRVAGRSTKKIANTLFHWTEPLFAPKYYSLLNRFEALGIDFNQGNTLLNEEFKESYVLYAHEGVYFLLDRNSFRPLAFQVPIQVRKAQATPNEKNTKESKKSARKALSKQASSATDQTAPTENLGFAATSPTLQPEDELEQHFLWVGYQYDDRRSAATNVIVRHIVSDPDQSPLASIQWLQPVIRYKNEVPPKILREQLLERISGPTRIDYKTIDKLKIR